MTVELHAYPRKISAGGIILLEAACETIGAFDVEWRIEGPAA